MNEFVEYLQSVGPFTAPVCVALALGMWWLVRDRERILVELSLALADAKELRGRRADDLVQSIRDYQEHAAANRTALERLIAAVRGLGASEGG